MIANSRRVTCGKGSFFIVVALGLLIALTGSPALAAEKSGSSPEGVGLQAASWLATIPYGDMKVALALTGASWAGSPGR